MLMIYRLTSRGDIAYTYDWDGNLLTEKGDYREAEYRYNGQHRMVYSAITDVIERTRVSTAYQYDGFGRRTITQEANGQAMRTLYDAFTFEVVREGITYAGGTFTTQFETGRLTDLNTGTEGSRYRWIGEAQNDSRYRYIGDEASPTRYTGILVTLYGRGEAVAINRNASSGGRGSSAYLGKDILGSVRSSTNEYGIQEDRYEYDAFGKPYEGDFSDGMNLGYTGKPYDAVTGLYNYGYRDYAPEAARFTTIDPIRDGSNWFSYVNNDPVNYTDLWGLSASDKGNSWTGQVGEDMSDMSTWVSVMNSMTTFGTRLGEETVTSPSETIRSIADNNLGQKYAYGNQCDDWVAKILNEAGVNSSLYFSGDTRTKTVSEHIESVIQKNTSQTTPNVGANVVFMNNSPKGYNAHAGLLIENDDGTVDFYHSSSGNIETLSTKEDTYASVQVFQEDFAYNNFYYQSVQW
ncbi:hypothetical protein FACS1894151_06680 [Spirochaetia bacterium]|nr:hypothetical protein FACS1894151_06680 [Spirochaetia bacterium]